MGLELAALLVTYIVDIICKFLLSNRKSIGIHRLDVVREDLQEARLIGKGRGSKISWVQWGKAGGTSYQERWARAERG